MSAARIKQIDKEKNALLKKVDPLIAKKKKLYSNMDITSAKSPEEKQLDKEISDLFSRMNTLILEKRKLTNFGSMPIKKKPVSEKEKLQAKTIDQLKRQAKKLGGKLVTPEGKAKTKEQLINTIVMKLRLSGQSDRQVGRSNTAKDASRQAKAPGKRTSSTGRVYYERRANRSDRGFMLGAGPVSPAKAKALQKKRDLIRKYIDEIIEVGPNYAVWQNAQGAYKNAKAIEKLLRNW